MNEEPEETDEYDAEKGGSLRITRHSKRARGKVNDIFTSYSSSALLVSSMAHDRPSTPPPISITSSTPPMQHMMVSVYPQMSQTTARQKQHHSHHSQTQCRGDERQLLCHQLLQGHSSLIPLHLPVPFIKETFLLQELGWTAGKHQGHRNQSDEVSHQLHQVIASSRVHQILSGKRKSAWLRLRRP